MLLVEDSSLTAEQLRDLMRTVPHRLSITTLATEREAIASVSTTIPDVVVLDLKLRQGSGFRVLKKIAELDPKPAVAVLTNYALPKYRELAFLTGADYFLDKAVDFGALPSVIESIVDKRRAQSVN